MMKKEYEMIKSLPLLTNPTEQKQAVFLAFVSKHPIWKDYDHIAEEDKNLEVPLVLMLQRWDGLKGFVGGEVEPGEELLTALKREVEEEIGYNMKEEDMLNLRPVSSHQTPDIVTHLFTLEVDFNKMKGIVEKSLFAPHAMSEIVSVMPVPFINYPHRKSFDNFMENNFACTVKEEVGDLIGFFNWSKQFNLSFDFLNK